MKGVGSVEWVDQFDNRLRDVCQQVGTAWRRASLGSAVPMLLTGLALVLSYRVAFWAFSTANSMLFCSPCRHTWNNIGRKSYENELCFPEIDVVYTWVNGSDLELLKAISKYRSEDGELAESKANQAQKDLENGVSNPEPTDDTKHGQNRFRDNDELKYSIRSLWMYAPWVRNVYIVTNGQVPAWMDITHPNLHVITHEQIFPNRSHLPVFSSPAIEVHLHRIPGLSDKFIYFNDDTMLGNMIWPEDFWTREFGQKVYLSWDVPQCNPGCPDSWLNDNYCDPVCNTSSCNFDEGDCGPGSVQGDKASAGSKQWKGRPTSVTRAEPMTNIHEPQSYCEPGCPNSWLGDKVCDRACKTVKCGFDAGDCGTALVRGSVQRYNLSQNGMEILVPAALMSAYVDMSEIVPSTITSAEHECELFVRSAIIIQSEKLLILVFLPPLPAPASCTVAISTRVVENGTSTDKVITFYIRREALTTLTTSKSNSSEIAESRTIPASAPFMHNSDPGHSAERSSTAYEPAPFFTQLKPDHDSAHDEALQPGAPELTPSVSLSKPVHNEAQSSAVPEPALASPAVPEPAPFVSHSEPTHEQDFVESAPQPAARALLTTEIQSDNFERIIRETAVLGVPSETDPEQVVLPKDMTERDWIRAEQILNLKKQQLMLLAQYELEKQIRDLLNTYEPVLGPLWPWQLVGLNSERLWKFHDRRMLDAFGDSLRYVTRLYNAYFSVQSRKVPAHMPHMIDKRIVSELQSIWPHEFDATSTHRFRSSLDVQFAFSFFYYLMEKPERFDPIRFFREEIDLDQDGYVSEMELRHLTNTNRQIPFSDLTNALINCSLALASARGHTLSPAEGVSVTEETLKSCPAVIRMLKPIVEMRKFFRHQKMPMDQVTFYMVGDNATVVRHRLEEVLVERKKFVCLNDDMRNPEPGVAVALHEFFEAYYPKPSPFELRSGKRNRYLYIDELQRWHAFMSILIFILEVGLASLSIYIYMQRSVIAIKVRKFLTAKTDKTL